MPSKSTSTKKATKPTGAKRTSPARKTPAKSAASAKTETGASAKSPAPKLPRIKPAEPVSDPEPEPKPKAPAETLSLIDPVKKKPRKTTATTPIGTILPPISKLNPAPAKESATAPTPEPAPKAETAEAQAVETDATGGGDGAEETPPPDEKIIHIKPPIIVRDLAEQLGVKPFQLIHDLMELQIFAAINQAIEPDVAATICEKHGFVFEKERREKGAGVHKPEPVIEPPPEPEAPKEEELRDRAPIVTMMGHVDHGKTSLLDHIRKARVASGEAGGITQHIGAYQVEHGGHVITFLDTPGHAAFTAMRARGANVTDIVVLVVAADDGLMPQTLEAMNHAKAAGAAIIVAINKVDLPAANIDKVKQQLQEQDMTPEDWGGDTIVCPVSAIKGTGIPELLEMISLQAEILELKASWTAAARAVVIESQYEAGRGPTATAIVKMGRLKVGTPFLCGNHWGKVKQLIGDDSKPIKEAGPATPVKILGFNGLPNAGDELVVMESERAARALSEERLDEIRLNKLAAPRRATLESLFDNIAEDQKKALRVVLKADVQGSLEALIGSLQDIPSDKISLELLHSAVGPVSESDVLLASASDAIIIGFGVKVENTASAAAKREGVQIKLYSIIYELVDQVKEAMAGMLEPELRETVVGHAEVKQVFDLSRGKVAGCMVLDGRISRTGRARLLRKKQPVYDGGVATLKRFQDDVKEVRAGVECGVKLGDFSEYEPGDIIECYTLEKVAQQL